MFISNRCLCSRTYDSLRPGNIKEWKVHKQVHSVTPLRLCNAIFIQNVFVMFVCDQQIF